MASWPNDIVLSNDERDAMRREKNLRRGEYISYNLCACEQKPFNMTKQSSLVL